MKSICALSGKLMPSISVAATPGGGGMITSPRQANPSFANQRIGREKAQATGWRKRSKIRRLRPRKNFRQEKMHRQIDHERKAEHQEQDKNWPTQDRLRLFAETVDPVDVLARIGNEIGNRQNDERDD